MFGKPDAPVPAGQPDPLGSENVGRVGVGSKTSQSPSIVNVATR